MKPVSEPQLSAEMRKQLKFAMANIFISYEALGKKVSAENVEKVVKHFLATALEEQRAEYLRIIDDNIRIEKMSHRVGAHSDDYGGESDYPCNCDKVEREHRVSALESVKKRLSILTKKEQ